ncbi:MAG: DNA mismatch repair protein MutS [Gammaproteobacteria bacterium]
MARLNASANLTAQMPPRSDTEALRFRSILFPVPTARRGRGNGRVPEFFRDLNLDQVVNGIVADWREYDLAPFYYEWPLDLETITYRQAVGRDLERPDVARAIAEFSTRMRTVRDHLGLIDELYYVRHKQGWFLAAGHSYCDAVGDLAGALRNLDLSSRGLRAFRGLLEQYVLSAGFVKLREDCKRVSDALAGVRYCILADGLTVTVRPFAGEEEYSNVIESVFHKFRSGAVKSHRTRLAAPGGMNHVEAQVLDRVALLYPAPFRDLEEFCRAHAGFLNDDIVVFDREVQFYRAYGHYMERIRSVGLRFCYPDVSQREKEIHCNAAFDLCLAAQLAGDGHTAVPNDIALRGAERILVVSGPNQGGKTTFARMFGQLHYLAALGLPVPGRHARLFLADNIFSHFERQENIETERSKLEDDLFRVRKMLRQVTSSSVVIINEIFSSTTVRDQLYLSEKILDQLSRLGALCVCVTFLDELSRLNEQTVSAVSTIDPHDPTSRTFKIERRPADGLAYAQAIAEKYGLTYQRLKERIQT